MNHTAICSECGKPCEKNKKKHVKLSYQKCLEYSKTHREGQEQQSYREEPSTDEAGNTNIIKISNSNGLWGMSTIFISAGRLGG